MSPLRHQWTGRHYSVVRTGLILAGVQVLLALVGYQLAEADLPLQPSGQSGRHRVFVLGVGPWPGRELSARGGAPFSCAYGWAYLVAAVWLNSMTAAWLTMITDAADFCRYTRSRKDMWWGTMLAGGLATAFSVSLGAYGAAASLGRQPNPFSLAAEVDPHWFTHAGFARRDCARRDHDQCDEPLHRRSFPLQHVRRPGTILEYALCRRRQHGPFGVAGAAGTPGSVDDGAGQFVCSGGGRAAVSLSVCGRMRIDVAALFDPKGIYHYWHGVNVTAIVWCFLGGGVYYLLPVAALPAVIVPLITGAGYLLTVRLLERLQPDSGKPDYELQASSPGE